MVFDYEEGSGEVEILIYGEIGIDGIHRRVSSPRSKKFAPATDKVTAAHFLSVAMFLMPWRFTRSFRVIRQ